MKILLKEPGGIRNPHIGGKWALIGVISAFDEGVQAVLDQMVEVDLDRMSLNWLLSLITEAEDYSDEYIPSFKPFTQFLKEQLEKKV